MFKSFWKAIIGINAVFPLLFAIFFRVANLPIPMQRFLAYGVIGVIFAGNILLYRGFSCKRKIIMVIIALNLFAMVFASDISFFTAIPDLPFYIKSWLWVAKELS